MTGVRLTLAVGVVAVLSLVVVLLSRREGQRELRGNGDSMPATRVGGRRWELRLRSGIVLRLPEAAPQVALATVAALDAETGLLDRAIAAVDLRDPARTLVRPRDGGDLTPIIPPAAAPALQGAG